MASSSSSSTQQKYQVFLSFRGEDTRNNFTSHLHWALERKGIHTFIDNQLKRGDEISQALLTAIEESTISIVILSKNYASSSWCLDELSKILDCKEEKRQIVVPIFYHVDPSHVRNQLGSFEEAFAKHQERFNNRPGKVERWRAALFQVGGLAGCHIHKQPNDQCESEHIKNIVEDISKKLIYNSSNDFKSLVGIDSRIKEIESKLCFELADVRILGIWGMGGIGKTTIAEAIVCQYYANFEGCYILKNVRDKSKSEVIRLRDELLCKILEERNLNIGTNVLPPFILNKLQHKKVFIVVDDVDDPLQLDLLPEKHCFGPGSRIIVTSRDKQVLQPIVDVIYKVNELPNDEALQLFSLHAFKQSHPKEDFTELSKKVVHYANGVPLALKVLGSALYGRTKKFWEGELNKIKEIPIPKIDNILRIGFDGLDREVKDIFFDIACFFKGMDRVYVDYILEGCYISTVSGINVLIDKSLITISHNMLEMHDLLQQMGWNIVSQNPKKHGKFIECGKRSRLWTHKDIYHVLKNNTGTESIEGMFLDMSKIRKVHLSPTTFARMHNLKLLKFYYSSTKERKVYLSQQGLESLPDTLSLLHWDGYPSKSLPSNFCPENLVELRMPNSHVKQLWNGVQNLVKLKGLDLHNSRYLIKIPDLSRATTIERMMLYGCTRLVELPSSIRYLNKLFLLDLENCQNLRNFPSNVHLRSLQFLILNYCSNVTKFPENLKNLEMLFLSGTAIEEVPSSIRSLPRLKYLNLRNCKRLERLSTNICKLKFLEELDLYSCLKLEIFPKILETMECLRYLWLGNTSIKELPSSIINLVGLFELNLDYCLKLKQLPSRIRKLKSLGILSLKFCSNITKFPKIPGNLVMLNLSGTAIEQLPSSIKCLSRLQLLNLKYCKRLQSLPEFPPNLHCLIARDCTSPELEHNWTKPQLSILATEDVKRYHKNSDDPISIWYLPASRKFFPGSYIPKWFSSQNLGSSVTTMLPPHLLDDKFVGFALCVVVALDDFVGKFKFNVHCQCNFKTNGDDCQDVSIDLRSSYGEDLKCIDSDYVFVAYDIDLYHGWFSGERKNHLDEASFEFSVNDDFLVIKKCGVCLLYSQEDLMVFPHRPSDSHSDNDSESESESESENESDAEECNPFMIQPSSYDRTWLSLKCGAINPDFEEPMVEDGTIIKRPREA